MSMAKLGSFMVRPCPFLSPAAFWRIWRYFNIIIFQFREKKSGREVRLKDEACSENGHAADKSETRKKYPNNFRKPKPKKIQEVIRVFITGEAQIFNWFCL